MDRDSADHSTSDVTQGVRRFAQRALNVPGGKQYDDEVRGLHARIDEQAASLTALRGELGGLRDELERARTEFRETSDRFADVVESLQVLLGVQPEARVGGLDERVRRLEGVVGALEDLPARAALVESTLLDLRARAEFAAGPATDRVTDID